MWDSGRVHGIRLHPQRDQQDDLLMAIFGGAQLAFVTHRPTEQNTMTSWNMATMKQESPRSPSSLTHLTLSDYIWDIRFQTKLSEETIDKSPKAVVLAVGLAHNVVELWSLQNRQANTASSSNIWDHYRLYKMVCDVRCITYCLDFHGWNGTDENMDLTVAVGTVFNEILIWSVWDSEKAPNGTLWENPSSQEMTVMSRPVLHRLVGHEGVLFSVRYGPNKCIASTSDDRTVRLWQWDDSIGTYVLKWTAWGHSSRVWDVDFVSGENFQLVSCGQDGTARLWDGESGRPISVWHPHFKCNPSLWTVRASLSADYIVAGGNNGSVQVWGLNQFHSCSTIQNVVPQESTHGDLSKDTEVENEDHDYRSFLVPIDEKSITMYQAQKSMNEKQQLEDSAVDGCESPLDHEFSQKVTIDEIDSPNLPVVKKKKKKKKKAAKKACDTQAIFAMNLFSVLEEGEESTHNLVPDCLLVATRAGSLWSRNLSENVSEQNEWRSHKPWWRSTRQGDVNDSNNIDPSQGSCIAIHPNGKRLVVGTTKGDLILAPLVLLEASTSESIDKEVPIVLELARPYFAVQGLSWIDADNFLSFHIRGIVIYWSIDEKKDGSTPFIQCILNMGTVGVPLSYALDNTGNRLAVGDSRGNIALFDIGSESKDEVRQPLSIVRFAHQKEHVTDLVFAKQGSILYSCGNDGCLHECSVSASGELQTSLSLPAASLSGITNIWRRVDSHTKEERIIVGGFFGNTFVLLDLFNGYEFFSVDTGGRQRRQDFFVQFTDDGSIGLLSFGIAVCSSRKDGRNEVMVWDHCAEKSPNEGTLSYPIHGETINDVCWCPTSSLDRLILLSGSDDCTARLSLYHKGNLSFLQELAPHETGVRAVCSSHHEASTSTLLVTCGGKLSMAFYRMDELIQNGESDFHVHYLGTNKLLVKPSIDHRINAVSAIPLYSDEADTNDSHLVLSGDSNGSLHVFFVQEKLNQSQKIIGHLLCTDSRPILCIATVRLSEDHVLALVGDTGGQVQVWCLSGRVTDEGLSNLPLQPIHIYQAHQNGTNCVDAIILSQDSSNSQKFNVRICSGGDDQALTVCSAQVEIDMSTDDKHHNLLFQEVHLKVFEGASSSALKGIKAMQDKNTRGARLYCVGYDQRISLWHLNEIACDESLHFISSSMSDVDDISALDCICCEDENGCRREFTVVAGEGMEMVSFTTSIPRAARALNTCDYLLITVGAGFSADSGLATYEHMPAEYQNTCDPTTLVRETRRFQEYWLNFAHTYASTDPHHGYSILEKWCGGSKLKKLQPELGISTQQSEDEKSLMTPLSPWWIYSSNVDGHFRRHSCFRECICEIHGYAGEFRCAAGTGRTVDGKARQGELWDAWNNQHDPMVEKCTSSVISIDPEQVDSTSLACKNCGSPTRPNVLLFHDTDQNVLRDIQLKRDSYQKWEAMVEDGVANHGRRLVILELGCGTNVPAVREEGEEVLADCLGHLKGNMSGGNKEGNVTLIRINPKDAESPADSQMAANTISIYETAERALLNIDQWLNAADRDLSTQ
eukprot:scaffold33114_cov55-Attheya_sp.AAC.2